MTPAAQVAIDVLLLHRGHVGPALAQLIRDELREAGDAGYEEGFLDGQLALAAEITGTAAKPKRQPAPKRASGWHSGSRTRSCGNGRRRSCD